MALFTGKTATATSLNATLAQKGQALRVKQEREAQAAKNFLTAAQEAQEDSARAAAHALAVEQAVQILEEAGVTL